MQAVYWQMDHALRLYPLPHALVLSDSAPAADFVEKKSGCVCINPVSHISPSDVLYRARFPLCLCMTCANDLTIAIQAIQGQSRIALPYPNYADGDVSSAEKHYSCVFQGSLRNGTFAAYKPSSHEAELCDVPELME